MKPIFVLIVLSIKQVIRSKRFLAGGVIFYLFLFSFAFLISSRGPKAGNVKFYLSVAWFLLFAYSMATVVFLPVRFFAKERDERIIHILGTRPVSRFEFIWARFLSCIMVGSVLLSIGCIVIGAGAKALAVTRGMDLSFLSGCTVFPAPKKKVPQRQVAALARELAQDEAFLGRHGEEGVLQIAEQSLSMWRLKENETAHIVWQGLDVGSAGGRIRFVPQVSPVWEDVEISFSFGGRTLRRIGQPGVPREILFPAEASTLR